MADMGLLTEILNLINMPMPSHLTPSEQQKWHAETVWLRTIFVKVSKGMALSPTELTYLYDSLHRQRPPPPSLSPIPGAGAGAGEGPDALGDPNSGLSGMSRDPRMRGERRPQFKTFSGNLPSLSGLPGLSSRSEILDNKLRDAAMGNRGASALGAQC